MAYQRKLRADHIGPTKTAYLKNKEYILKTQDVCGICGKPVDKTLKYPHPMSATIDHIIPVSLGGSVIDRENMQLAHLCCNRQKSNKLFLEGKRKNATAEESGIISNRDLPWSTDWLHYRSNEDEEEDE